MHSLGRWVEQLSTVASTIFPPIVSFQCTVHPLILKRPRWPLTTPPEGAAPAHSFTSHLILAFRMLREHMCIVLSPRIVVIRSGGPRALTDAQPSTGLGLPQGGFRPRSPARQAQSPDGNPVWPPLPLTKPWTPHATPFLMAGTGLAAGRVRGAGDGCPK